MREAVLGQFLMIFIMVLVVDSVPIRRSPAESRSSSQSWIIRLLMNSIFYIIILLPLLLLRSCLKRMNLSESSPDNHRGCLLHCAQRCFEPESFDVETEGEDSLRPTPRYVLQLQNLLGLHLDSSARSPGQRCALLTICILGLQLTYVMWGIMQERIMTRDYDGQMFENSQFLVFCNRITALFIVLPIHWLQIGVKCNPFESGHGAPFFEFSFASVSNILSSWCQYEALKYVTFPTQVISKSCKVIPVMVMSWFIQQRKYSLLEYLTGGLISIGLSTFMLSDSTERITTPVRQPNSPWIALSGAILISGYMVLDSFTSNWQDRLFRKYRLSSVQVMVGVNLWSVLLTVFPLLCEGALISSFRFGIAHRGFLTDVTSSAICSAVGQLFIFITISFFGPATFVLIMTLRMGLSLFLSCILFGHTLSTSGILGVILVFGALFLRIYLRPTEKKIQSCQNPSLKI